jgi:hypothetical protein
MTLDLYRKKLLTLWFIGFVVPFVLLMFQFGNGKYGHEKSLEALGWLTSLTLSTILLMVGVMVANPVLPEDEEDDKPEEELTDNERKRRREAKAKADHEKFVFNITVGVSLLYLLIINMVFFLEPLVSDKPQELMRGYKIFLAVFDSLISLLIGYFFGKK